MSKQKQWRTFQSKQGLQLRVRPLMPDDVDLLIDLFEHMSAASRYQRFNEVLDNPDPDYVRREAAQLASVSPGRGKAWIAFADLPGQPDAPVAGFRFMRTEQPGVAEISIAVRDDIQRQQVGTKLLQYAVREAKAAGITKLVASFHSSNRGVWGLLARVPYHVTTRTSGSQTEVIVDLTQRRPSRHPRKDQNQSPAQPNQPVKESSMSNPVVFSFETHDGTVVRVRRETPEDVPLMIDLFHHMGNESRLHRFGDVLTDVDPARLVEEATRLATLDPETSMAWLALADLPGQPNTAVAGGRFTRIRPDEAEVHVVVRDDMQRKGIGSRLVYFVLDQARAAGIRKVIARFPGTNEAVWQVVQYSPYHVTWTTLGREVEVTFHLPARTSSKSGMN